MNTITFFAATAITATLTLSGAAIAKGHDQGGSDAPGTDVGAETVVNAQGVAVAVSGGKGKGAQGNLGKSGNAGKASNDK